MNLFLFAAGANTSNGDALVEALLNEAEEQPPLDTNTLWRRATPSYFAASVQPAATRVPPGRHVYADDARWVLADGTIVLPGDSDRCIDARVLAAQWEEIAPLAEGQFSVLKLDARADRAEFLNDFLGFSQTYWVEGNGFFLSNSARLLARIVRRVELDRAAVSDFLVRGWVGGDRTLLSSVRVVPAAAHWIWEHGSVLPQKRTYYSVATLSRQPRRRPNADHLRAHLGGLCRRIASDYDHVDCAITGGRDSRVLMSLLTGQGVAARYYIDGIPQSEEVRLSKHIADARGVPHRVVSKDVDFLAENWDAAARSLIGRTDGMVSLWQIADMLHDSPAEETWPLCFWGIGGEIARGYYGSPRWYASRDKTTASVTEFLQRRVLRKGGGIISPDLPEAAHAHVAAFVEGNVHLGVRLEDVPDLFYTYERVRRWAGTNARKATAHTDLFTPFCTRPFVEAAYALSSVLRFSEPLHYALLAQDKALFRHPFLNEPWRVQIGWLNLLQQVWRRKFALRFKRLSVRQVSAYNQGALLEAQLGALRDRCLQTAGSQMWSYLDRAEFERVTGAGLNAIQRRPYVHLLYNALTLFYYEDDLRRLQQVWGRARPIQR